MSLPSTSNHPGVSGNCEAHVDPGLVTLIPASEIPGLAVHSPTTQVWKSVEIGLRTKEDENPTVVVLAGEALELLTWGLVPAGLHRVECSNSWCTTNATGGGSVEPGTGGMSTHAPFSTIIASASPPAVSSRFSIVFDLQLHISTVKAIRTLSQEMEEQWVRKDTQPPLHYMQRAAGRRCKTKL